MCLRHTGNCPRWGNLLSLPPFKKVGFPEAIVSDDRLAPLLAALPPKDHLTLFLWLFPEDDLRAGDGAPSLFDFLVVLAQLQEHSGERAEALASYRRLLREFAHKGYDSRRTTAIATEANAAIQRLAN